MLSIDYVFDELISNVDYFRAGWTLVLVLIDEAGVEKFFDLQDVVNSIRWNAPFPQVPIQMLAKAGFIRIFLLAERANLGFPRHSDSGLRSLCASREIGLSELQCYQALGILLKVDDLYGV